jgi:hypothetical protein
MTTVILPAPAILYEQVSKASARLKELQKKEVPQFEGISPLAAYELTLRGKRYRILPARAGNSLLVRIF